MNIMTISFLLGCQREFFGCGLIYLYFLSARLRTLIQSFILQVLSASVSCRRPSAHINLTPEGKGRVSQVIKLRKFLNLEK